MRINFISSPCKADPLNFLEQDKINIQTKVLHLTSFRLINVIIDLTVITMAVKVKSLEEAFESIFLEVLNKYAPLKKGLVRATHDMYITKASGKIIMRRSKLESK